MRTWVILSHLKLLLAMQCRLDSLHKNTKPSWEKNYKKRIKLDLLGESDTMKGIAGGINKAIMEIYEKVKRNMLEYFLKNDVEEHFSK